MNFFCLRLCQNCMFLINIPKNSLIVPSGKNTLYQEGNEQARYLGVLGGEGQLPPLQEKFCPLKGSLGGGDTSVFFN